VLVGHSFGAPVVARLYAGQYPQRRGRALSFVDHAIAMIKSASATWWCFAGLTTDGAPAIFASRRQ